MRSCGSEQRKTECGVWYMAYCSSSPYCGMPALQDKKMGLALSFLSFLGSDTCLNFLKAMESFGVAIIDGLLRVNLHEQ